MTIRRWRAPWMVMVAALTIVPSLAGQSASDEDGIPVRVIVTDLVTQEPVQAAQVEFTVPGEPDPLLRSLTGSEGRFQLDAVSPGPYELTVQALGYHDLAHSVEIPTGQDRLEIRIEMVPQALELEPVVVTVPSRTYLTRVGFNERRDRGLGTYLDREEVNRRATLQVSDIFYTIAGARVQQRSGPGRYADITFRGGCVPDLFVDGVRTIRGTSVDDVLTVYDVEAMEVYRGGLIPGRFSSADCAAIVVWTRMVENEGQPFSWRRTLIAAGVFFGSLFLLR